MSMADKLRDLIRRRGFSQATVARRLGCHQTLISAWVRGKNTPDVHQGLALARLLGVPLDTLADDAIILDDAGDPVQKLAWLVAELGPAEVVRRVLDADLARPAETWRASPAKVLPPPSTSTGESGGDEKPIHNRHRPARRK
jgi:transcriptional regulator with XRE-family HTH domain